MNEVAKRIEQMGIVPVVVLHDAKDAIPLAKALCDGGLPCAEVTFRTDAAEESIRLMTENYPDMLVGAGTVINTEQVDRAVAAGARFIVCPGFNPKVVKHCIDKGVLVTPGTSNPSDVGQAIDMGLEVVKFFPAEASGGLKMIKAMAAPFTTVKFMPTGGINEKNVNDYLAFDRIIACGGSWMVSSDLIKTGDFEKIKELTKAAVRTMLGFELKHVGINCENETEAIATANIFTSMFEQDTKNGNKSVFSGSMIEAMKTPFLGANGHIAIGTNSVERAMSYLERKGYAFDMSTAKYEGNVLKAVYLKQEVAGFALHLVRK